MSLTQDKYETISTQNEQREEVKINNDNPFLQNDVALIVHNYEKNCQLKNDDPSSKVYLYRDVYATENFSKRAKEQLDYYPGMHQSSTPPKDDPLYTNAKNKSEDKLNYWNNALDNPDSFMNGLENNQNDFDYSTIFSSQSSGKEKAKNIGKMLTECIPCFDRLLDGNELLPDGDLLEIHLLNIKTRTDIIDKITSLFKDPGLYIDICRLLKLLAGLCPSDLFAINAVLTQYLAKLNLEINFNLDFAMQLVGPLLSPFLDSLSAWLDKWIQLILNPLICVLDHVNETILTMQQTEIPLSEISVNTTINQNSANPLHQNSSSSKTYGGTVGLGNETNTETDVHAGVWSSEEIQRFNTPDSEKYNPTRPEPPSEETELALGEIKQSFGESYTEQERLEANEKWAQQKKENKEKRYKVPPPLSKEKTDGTRWSKDDIPNSEKYVSKQKVEWGTEGYFPPEKQRKVKATSDYYVSTDLIPAIVEVRNILQGGIQYTKDWFQYATQMSYDLLGTDIGWMSKKTDRTILKSRIIQLLYMIKAIIEAVSKNGLECGTKTNYNEVQMKYILEDSLNKFSSTSGNKFIVLDNGDIQYGKSFSNIGVKDSSSESKTIEGSSTINSQSTENIENSTEVFQTGTPDDTISIESTKQSTVDSILIKNCFKSVSSSDLKEVQKWIADFESRS